MSEIKMQKCRVTVVEPGLPDRVIDVMPAIHATEKIWLDNRPGIERWAAVQQLMKNYCPRGKYVPEAAYWHQPGARPEDINTSTLKVEDIPMVTLDGAVFEPLPPKQHVSMPRSADLVKGAQDKIQALEQRVDKLTDSIASLVGALSHKEEKQNVQETDLSSL